MLIYRFDSAAYNSDLLNSRKIGRYLPTSEMVINWRDYQSNQEAIDHLQVEKYIEGNRFQWDSWSSMQTSSQLDGERDRYGNQYGNWRCPEAILSMALGRHSVYQVGLVKIIVGYNTPEEECRNWVNWLALTLSLLTVGVFKSLSLSRLPYIHLVVFYCMDLSLPVGPDCHTF